MENLGSEVSQKMRCAVKAKLIELGTGGSAGYIDDELPDYVMIMVANKRSKQQMISDLNLFLGQHTEVFVIWLHEVLQKLQEVTLPAIAITKGKRKTEDNDENSNSKKDKKERKKDKKLKKLPDMKNSNESQNPSITDVFVDHLLEKTKGTLSTEQISAKKESSNNSINDFDIPTISEIVQKNCTNQESSREKDVAELAEIQKKIYQAKKQLKYFDENDESEDEDFLNIKEDAEEFEDVVNKTVPARRAKSPITFEKSSDSTNIDLRKSERFAETRKKIIYHPKNNEKNCEDNQSFSKDSPRKRSIHERLGLRLRRPSISRNLESRQIEGGSVQKKKDSESNVSKNKPDKNRKIDNDKNVEKRKLVSKIIIAQTTKPNLFTDEDPDDYVEDNVKSISSIVKIKPRPTVSPSRQACKNLLLRAVAEAQKSIGRIQSIQRKENVKQNITTEKPQRQLYTKSFRNNRNEVSKYRGTKDNIVIKIDTDDYFHDTEYSFKNDEYIPEPISDRGDSETEQVYVPKTIVKNSNENTGFGIPVEINHNNKTQFVVTLDEKTGEKYSSKLKEKKTSKKFQRENSQSIKKPTVDSESNELPRNKLVRNHNKSVDVKKVVIRNDTDDDELDSTANLGEKTENNSKQQKNTTSAETSRQSSENSTKTRKRISVSPIKFDLNDDGRDALTDGDREQNESNKKLLRKSDHIKKYDKIPELLSAVNINKQPIKLKIKERCKYFPSCTNSECEYFHPSAPCKSFPSCKFADNCLYIHPKCKFDLSCNRNGCNFSHTTVSTQMAPPLSSHVVPVQNYKTITATPLPTMCKYYPNCSNQNQCTFYHPKICRFGKNCMNKVECNFYHHDLPSNNKFKWIATSA